METFKFNKTQMQEIEHHLKSLNRSYCCSNPQIELLEELFLLPAASNSIPGPAIELFVTVCKTCAKTELFNLQAANISR
ncbi:hypothetical protein [Macrococcoides caseolyticum]|uniref:hypothetical protein n=1 Tax=Macrococcoides caseolyticum TaxID=69966 RepID=UPI001C5D8B01|nr:hypothetical protein [Macrococcus caseolyticus]QYA36363.1 hypothetical protein KYI08_05710 [Macrococcus caseolyticus]